MRWILICAAVLHFASAARAQDAGDDSDSFEPNLTNSFPIQVKSQMEKAGDLLEMPRIVVTSSIGKFTAVLGPGYRVESSDQNHVTYAGEHYDRFVMFRIIDRLIPADNPLHHDEFRPLLVQRYPKATVLTEARRSVAGAAALSFDLEMPAVEGLRRKIRIVYVTCGSGVLESTFMGSADQFNQQLQDFSRMLLTLRTCNPNEEPVINRMSSML